MHRSTFSLALPAGWRARRRRRRGDVRRQRGGGDADATLWVERDPKLDFPTFEARSMRQLRRARRERHGGRPGDAPQADATIVKLAADAPQGWPGTPLCCSVSGPYRCYLDHGAAGCLACGGRRCEPDPELISCPWGPSRCCESAPSSTRRSRSRFALPAFALSGGGGTAAADLAVSASLRRLRRRQHQRRLDRRELERDPGATRYTASVTSPDGSSPTRAARAPAPASGSHTSATAPAR